MCTESKLQFINTRLVSYIIYNFDSVHIKVIFLTNQYFTRFVRTKKNHHKVYRCLNLLLTLGACAGGLQYCGCMCVHRF